MGTAPDDMTGSRGCSAFPQQPRHAERKPIRVGLLPHRRGPKPKHDPLAEEVRKLKQQNGQLTQRLARAELIIDVQKKVSLLLGIPLAAADNDGNCL